MNVNKKIICRFKLIHYICIVIKHKVQTQLLNIGRNIMVGIADADRNEKRGSGYSMFKYDGEVG